jgi:hypothetical protein
MERIVQDIGLFVALGFIVFSVDDLAWDILNIVRNIRRGELKHLPFESLDAAPPKLLAVVIAAWHEDNVLEAVVDNMLSSLQYPQSMYHVFIGVYPNDEATISVVDALARKHDNVHFVVNARPGPTSKADNVNNVIRAIKQYESERGWRFCSITLHDAEDVVHPYELKLTNYLLDSYDVLQFPVIPLQKMPTLRTILRGMTIGTYADEFAENHYRAMGTREAMSAMVPSAGTGFVVSHRILDLWGDHPLLPEDSLTEDYKLSLTLAEKGFNTHFVLEKVPRLMDNYTVRWDFVATRSFFPDTFKTAVRQKTRWIYGITMQSAKVSEIFKPSSMGLAGRYSLYKDLKAKLSNIMVLPGYLVFLYYLASLFFTLPYIYPQGTLAYGLCVFLTLMMVFRQIMRAVAITNFYGFKSMAVACLLPPLMPVRLVWGNIINLTATLKAWKLYFFGTGTKKKPRKVAWSKTDHTFLQDQVLRRYYRNVGDVLLEKQYIDVSALSAALRQSREEGRHLGEALLRQDLVTENQLAEAVASVRHNIFVDNLRAFTRDISGEFDKDMLEKLLLYPVLKTEAMTVFAVNELSDIEEARRLPDFSVQQCSFVYTTRASILEAIHSPSSTASTGYRYIIRRLDAGAITWEQAVLAIDKYGYTANILSYMGLAKLGGCAKGPCELLQNAEIPAAQWRSRQLMTFPNER